MTGNDYAEADVDVVVMMMRCRCEDDAMMGFVASVVTIIVVPAPVIAVDVVPRKLRC